MYSTLPAGHSNWDGTIFYSNPQKGAHPILNEQVEIEKVFEPIDTYLDREQFENLDQQMTRIFILRHTESQANSQGINAGCMDFPLSKKGIQDAEKLGEQLAQQMKSLPIHAVYCTKLTRTTETYEHMNKEWTLKRGGALPKPQNKPHITDALIERNNGNVEGMLKKDYEPLKQNEAEALKHVVAFDELFSYKIPEGGSQYESLQQIWDRVVPSLNSIAQDHRGDNVLVISHVGVMRALVVGCAAAQSKPVTLNYRKFDIKNGGMLALKSNGSGIKLEATSPFDYEKSKKQL